MVEKFWNSVEKTNACWLWKGFTDKSGLPVIRTGTGNKGNFSEHYPRRIALELSGIFLPKGTQTQLSCQNKLCVNPTHLVYGDEARFWNKVQKLDGINECWVWCGTHDKDMYGFFKVQGKQVRAHIYSYELFVGRPIAKGLLVCHTCDHPYCVNPYHLFPGTHADNHEDRDRKGHCALAKLAESQVKEIRELHLQGATIAQLSDQFSIGYDAISLIVTRKRWKWVS